VDASPASYTWVVDTTAPDTTITANPTHLTISHSASFSFTGSDGSGSGVASFECSLDAAAFAACTSPQSYTSLHFGPHRFKVRAIDTLGFVDASPAVYYWVIIGSFQDVSVDYWAAEFIERLISAGTVTGCSLTPQAYCPDRNVTRAEAAVLLMRAKNGPGYVPPALPPAGSGFSDVPAGYWADRWVKAAADANIMIGYGGGIFQPDKPLTRAEMAIILLRAIHTQPYTPPALPPSGSGFIDVPDNYWAATWIAEVKAESIAFGYGDGSYGPENLVSRAEMAVFVVRAFKMP